MRFNEVSRNSEEDDYGTWDVDDTRRPKLTLKHLNKMRKVREMAKLEHMEQSEGWKDMYARNSE